jgi:hypothetical protein
MGRETTASYDLLYDIIRRRSSIRKLKPDPIPDEYIKKILEAGRWAMSGANSQPWEYIVVKDPRVKKDLFRCYAEDNTDFIYWMEQQRVFELRHPAYQMTADRAVEQQRRGTGWSEAPALIVVVGDGRRQWGTVQGAHTFGRDQSHLTDGLANTCTLMHFGRSVARSWYSVGDDSCARAVQEGTGRAGSHDALSHYSDRLSGAGAVRGRSAPAGGDRSLRSLRRVKVHEQ